MIIQITNRCHMGCSHCMQCSSPDGANMTTGTFFEAVKFAERSNAHVILLTGGEPTEHPDFEDMVATCCRKFVMVLITTNGMWIDTPEKVDAMQRLFARYDNLTMQITNISKYYPKAVDIQQIKDLFGCNAFFETEHLNLLALGRAAQDPVLVRESESSLGTMSCFSSALVSAQLPYQMAIANMESRGKFCHRSWIIAAISIGPSHANVHHSPTSQTHLTTSAAKRTPGVHASSVTTQRSCATIPA